MRILIVNDDGLYSNGMLHLENELSRFFEVYAICPDRQRSATSQAITIRETLIVKRVFKNHYHINGFPVDCVNIGINGNLIPRVDLVVSGINHGPNLGDDVHYSGTVGAARHAAVHNYKAIAISCEKTDLKGNFQRPAIWLRKFILENYDKLKTGIVYNMNYPYEPDDSPAEDEFPAVEFTYQGRRLYKDSYEILEESGDQFLIKLKEAILGKDIKEGSDFYALLNKRISITPLKLNTTDEEELRRWKLYESTKQYSFKNFT